MNRDHGTDARVCVQGCGYAAHVQVKGIVFDVGKDGSRASPDDSSSSREESVRRDDNFVAWTDAESEQREVKRVGPGGTADRTCGTAIGGDLALKGRDLFAEDELLRVDQARDCRKHFIAEACVLRL